MLRSQQNVAAAISDNRRHGCGARRCCSSDAAEQRCCGAGAPSCPHSIFGRVPRTAASASRRSTQPQRWPGVVTIPTGSRVHVHATSFVWSSYTLLHVCHPDKRSAYVNLQVMTSNATFASDAAASASGAASAIISAAFHIGACTALRIACPHVFTVNAHCSGSRLH